VLGINGQITLGALGAGYVQSDAGGVLSSAALPGGFTGFANPAGTVGLVAVNGAATTAMRSDGAPPLSQAIIPTWTELHTFNAGWTIDNTQVGTVGAGSYLSALGIRAALAVAAAGLHVPWIAGDARTTAYFGSVNAANNQNAIHAVSYSGIGVYGTSTTAYGGDFYSPSYTALLGQSSSATATHAGVLGWGTAGACGVYGLATSGIGVYAVSATGTGLEVDLSGAGTIATFKDNSTPTLVIRDGGITDFAEYIRHLSDPDNWMRFQVDQWTLSCGGTVMINAVEAGTDYLWLHAGLVGINETANANMTIGLTIDQAAHDDEIVNFRSSDVGAARSTVETGTWATISKTDGGSGGAALYGYKDAGGSGFGSLRLTGYLPMDADVAKTTAARAIVETHAYQTDGADLANTVADGNVFVIRTRRGGSTVATHWFDEDGDFGYNGALVPYDDLDDAAMARDLQLVLTGRQGVRYNQDAMVAAGILHPSEHGVMVSHKRMTALQLGAIRQGYEDRLALEQRIEYLEEQLKQWQ